MKRRAFLAAGTTTLLAGCNGSASGNESDDTNNNANSTEQTGDLGEIGGIDSGQLHSAYLSSSLREFRIGNWKSAQKVRVYDAAADDLAFVEASNDLFVQVRISVYNAGGEPLPTVDLTDFRLYQSGEEYSPIAELPSNNFGFEDLRENEYPQINDPKRWGALNEIAPNSSNSYHPLFDISGDFDNWALNITNSLESAPEQDQYLYFAR